MPKSTKVRLHGNNVRDIIIAHVISADAHTYMYIYIYRHGNRKVILGPAGRAPGWSKEVGWFKPLVVISVMKGD